jgi:transposase
VDGRAFLITPLTGILFVLLSRIPWQMLPRELGCGSGMTCWRRLRDWQQEGIWDLVSGRRPREKAGELQGQAHHEQG